MNRLASTCDISIGDFSLENLYFIEAVKKICLKQYAMTHFNN